VGIEAETNNFHLVTFEGVVALSSVSVPNFSLFIKRASDNLVSKDLNEMAKQKELLKKAGHLPEGVIEGHAVDNIAVLVQGKQLLARVRVPDFASPIVRASDEFVSAFVEGTVG
jgi:hypothetical protein